MSVAHDLPAAPIAEPRKLVGVTTLAAADERPRLWKALELVLPVTFQVRAPTELDDLDGLLIIDHEEAQGSVASLASCPTLTVHDGYTRVATEGGLVQFADNARLAHPLRGRKLLEERAGDTCSWRPRHDDVVLATVGRTPVWWVSRSTQKCAYVSAFAPQELGEREALREHLRFGRFMGLLALLHFLRDVCGELDTGAQPLRAAFVIDDPNLHRTSYGYLDYAELVSGATRHGYHVAFATVPLDGWLVSGRAATLLRDNPSAISLLMHGNDHTTEELGRITEERTAYTALAQALRRAADCERRCRLPVERIMVPPHEVCATAVLKTMFRLDFEGACIGRGRPWIKSQSSSPLSWPLVKWFPTDLVGGLPIIPRYPMDQPWDDLVFRALLGQPLILFAHHWDFADGLEVLARATEYINGLGDVRWASVGSIARQSYVTKRRRDTLIVHLYSRRATLDVPEWANSVEVRIPCTSAEEPPRSLICGGLRIPLICRELGRDGCVSGLLPAVPGRGLELAVAADRPLDPPEAGGGASTPWPLVRRALVEGRDRLQPHLRKLRVR